jgi:hypothetical protein
LWEGLFFFNLFVFPLILKIAEFSDIFICMGGNEEGRAWLLVYKLNIPNNIE